MIIVEYFLHSIYRVYTYTIHMELKILIKKLLIQKTQIVYFYFTIIHGVLRA